MSALDRLAELRIDGQAPASDEPVVVTNHSVLAFDQTLTTTGWVYMIFTVAGSLGPQRIEVFDAGTLRCGVTGRKGWDTTFARADAMEKLIRGVVRTFYPTPAYVAGTAVVYEYPTTMGRRIESQFGGALLVRQAARDQQVPCYGVSTQHARGQLTGHAGADKKMAGEWLQSRPWLIGADKLTNEHIRDGAMLGTTYGIRG